MRFFRQMLMAAKVRPASSTCHCCVVAHTLIKHLCMMQLGHATRMQAFLQSASCFYAQRPACFSTRHPSISKLRVCICRAQLQPGT